jgi:hypothetical protein
VRWARDTAAVRTGECFVGGAIVDGKYDGCIGVHADWMSRAAHAPLIVPAPGMEASSIAPACHRPILLVLTDQLEWRVMFGARFGWARASCDDLA